MMKDDCIFCKLANEFSKQILFMKMRISGDS